MPHVAIDAESVSDMRPRGKRVVPSRLSMPVITDLKGTEEEGEEEQGGRGKKWICLRGQATLRSETSGEGEQFSSFC